MKKAFFFIIVVFSEFVLFAQTERDVYKSLRTSGIKSLEKHRYADAISQLEAAKELYDCTEIQQDIKRTNDSIDAAYNRAKNTYNTRGTASKQRAIIMFSELAAVRSEAYAYIGQCYEYLDNVVLAKDNYNKGIATKDSSLSAYWYALLLRKTAFKTSVSQRIWLYKKATIYVGVKDSLGVEYERLEKVDSAYYWYNKSTSAFSKYNRASLLLNPANKIALSNITDDPFKLLEYVANDTSSDSKKTIRAQAAYYLGMLYRDKSKTKGDEINKLGWQWIERAANMGHSDAKRILYRKNEYVK